MSRHRWRAIATAGHAGDIATARTALHDTDPVARELGLGALARAGTLDDATLARAFEDPHPAVRRRAAVLAAGRPGLSLRPLLGDGDDTVVEAAAWACGEQQSVSDEVFEQLVRLAVDAADALVREACVAALGALGDERGLPAVLHGCTDKPAVRRRAVLALAPFDGDDVMAALRAATTDRDWQVRQAAEDVLRARGDTP